MKAKLNDGAPFLLEEGMEELDRVLDELSKEDIPLTEAFSLYKHGMELLKACDASIEKVEKEMILLEEGTE